RLWLSTVSFKFPPDPTLSNRTLFDFQGTASSESNHDLMEADATHRSTHGHPYPYPAIEELGFVRVGGISLFEKLNFARQLPNLKRVLFINETFVADDTFEDDHDDTDISDIFLIGDRLPDVPPGFRSLEKFHFVEIHHENVPDPGNKHPLLALSSTNNLKDLELGGVVIQKELSLAIRRHSIHLTGIEIKDCVLNRGFTGSELMVHTLLGQCFALKKFKCQSRDVPLYCDPVLFDRYPWVCSDLEVLVVAPDCTLWPGIEESRAFTSEEAQEGLFRQISTMTQLKELGFAGCVGLRSFSAERGLYLLKDLDQLEMLDVSCPFNFGGADLTEQHAEFMVAQWPQLKTVLRGPYHIYESPEFSVYMATHRPHVKVARLLWPVNVTTDQVLAAIRRGEEWMREGEPRE
ncbi:hypothetical protein B0O80DRAFT_521583, partial [Mortierella sp. GBAus27b]